MRRTKTTFGAVATLVLGAAVFACGVGVAEAHKPWNDSGQMVAPVGQGVSVSLESGYGGVLPTYYHNGSMFVAGQTGERYNIRVTNNTGERIEAVVTVDGRDVISGQLGDYKSQRGYVLEPYGSVVIDGFRQSLDHVAAFRFTDVGNSYSARWGTPQHVGVIGVAAFKEHVPWRQRRQPPAPIATRPYYDPYYGGDYEGRASGGATSTPTAPAADAAAESSAKSASPRGGYYQRDRAEYSRNPQLGTQYGETQHSSVREVTFERKHKRRPDVLLTMYYDSPENLRARGVIVDHYHAPPPVDPRPFPYSDRERHNAYAPPPPRRY
jgi:hypothetical protein